MAKGLERVLRRISRDMIQSIGKGEEEQNGTNKKKDQKVYGAYAEEDDKLASRLMDI